MSLLNTSGRISTNMRNDSGTSLSYRNLTKITQIPVTPKSSKFYGRSHTLSNLSVEPMSPASRTSNYLQMTSNTTIRNLLLDVNSELKHSIKKSINEQVTLIQATFRRYLVMTKIREKERNRQCSKYTIKKECFDDSVNWNSVRYLMKYKDYMKYIYKPVNKELNNIIEILQNKNEDLHKRIQIFNLLCSCFKAVDRDFISYNDAEMFLVKILRVNLDSNLINQLLNSLVEGGNKIHYPTLLECLYVYKSIVARLFDFIKPNYPTTFVNSYMSLKSSIYDSILSVYIFDEKNPPVFQCPVCHGTSTRPKVLCKHIVRCKKNNLNN